MGKFKDLTGKQVNNWKILEFKEINKHGASTWLCECQCEHKTLRIHTPTSIKQNKSCRKCSNKIENLYGNVYGMLKVIEPSYQKNKHTLSKCICSCGNIIEVRNTDLKNGKRLSCGCDRLYKRNKESKNRLFRIWCGMIYRCHKCTKGKDYINYKKRGIQICDEWLNDENGYFNFKQWSLSNGYNDNLTIDRINNDGNYEPNNCRWVNNFIQANNKRDTVYANYHNELIPISDLARKFNIKRETVLRRHQCGLIDEDLVFKGILNNASGIVGVSWSNSQQNWRSYININNKRIELGRSKDKTKAIQNRLSAEIRYFGKEYSPQRHLFEEYGIEVSNE